jgi:hypothetical protein
MLLTASNRGSGRPLQQPEKAAVTRCSETKPFELIQKVL